MKIAVYLGSSDSSEEMMNAARTVGRFIGEKKHTLVYGGGDTGLMGVVAREAFYRKVDVIGVIPTDVDFIASRPQPFVTTLIKTENMSKRKQKMLELADAFIALPGGIGTLDEISEAITLTKIHVFNKKCVLFNQNGFYDSLKDLFLQMEKQVFLDAESMKHVLFSDDIEEIEDFLKET